MNTTGFSISAGPRAIRQAEVSAARTMIKRTEQRFDIKPERLAGDTAYGSGANLNWLVNEAKIAPHIPVVDKSKREDDTFSREDWPLAARAQQPPMPVVGFVNSVSPGWSYPPLAAFVKGLGESGFVEGRNVAIEYRWAEGHCERLPDLIADLVQRKVSVITATSTPAAVAAKSATSTIPIVFEIAADPVELGLVASLSRPGGNVTGVTNLTVELASKQLGLLRELVHGTTAITVLTNPHYPGTEKQLRDVGAAARMLGLQLIVLRASTERELETMFATMAQQSPGTLLVSTDPFLVRRCDQIISLAARHATPAMYSARECAVAGGLMSYAPNFADSYREAGIYTGRILRGEKPADLPVQQSTRFEFVINLKTAKALGIEVPNSMQLLANEVIE